MPPPGPEIDERSCCNNRLPIVQPRFSWPIKFDFSALTSSKKHWQKSELPAINSIGFTLTPGWSIEKSTKLMPSCFGALGSVRTRQNIQSALSANVVQIFDPLTR